MPNVSWKPDEQKPEDAAELEAEIARAAPGAQVKLTLKDGAWLVRALTPAAMCGRGAEFSERDVSSRIVEILIDHDHVAGLHPNRRSKR